MSYIQIFLVERQDGFIAPGHGNKHVNKEIEGSDSKKDL